MNEGMVYKILYLVTRLNFILYVGYYFLWLLDFVAFPKTWDASELSFGFACFFLPLLGIGGLKLRDEFDLIRMEDGTSKGSRFIWSILVGLSSFALLYAFFVGILEVGVDV